MEVLHRVHPSALLMMHLPQPIGSVKRKKEYHWWHVRHVHSTDDAELDRGASCSFGWRKIDTSVVDYKSK